MAEALKIIFWDVKQVKFQIKDNEAVLRRFPIADVELIEKQPISLMPADLHKLMTEKELIDLIEYLTTLKAAQKSG